MKRLVFGLLLVSLAAAGGLSHLAAQAPDGLEHSLARHGVEEGEALVAAPMPDYQAPIAGQFLAGISGTFAVFGLVLVVGWLLGRRRGQA